MPPRAPGPPPGASTCPGASARDSWRPRRTPGSSSSRGAPSFGRVSRLTKRGPRIPANVRRAQQDRLIGARVERAQPAVRPDPSAPTSPRGRRAAAPAGPRGQALRRPGGRRAEAPGRGIARPCRREKRASLDRGLQLLSFVARNHGVLSWIVCLAGSCSCQGASARSGSTAAPREHGKGVLGQSLARLAHSRSRVERKVSEALWCCGGAHWCCSATQSRRRPLGARTFELRSGKMHRGVRVQYWAPVSLVLTSLLVPSVPVAKQH